MKGTPALTGAADADELLDTDPLAVLSGTLLDQRRDSPLVGRS